METDPLVRHQDSAALLGVTRLGSSALSTFGPCTLGTATWSHVGAVDRCCYIIPPSPSRSQGNIQISTSHLLWGALSFLTLVRATWALPVTMTAKHLV